MIFRTNSMRFGMQRQFIITVSPEHWPPLVLTHWCQTYGELHMLHFRDTIPTQNTTAGRQGTRCNHPPKFHRQIMSYTIYSPYYIKKKKLHPYVDIELSYGFLVDGPCWIERMSQDGEEAPADLSLHNRSTTLDPESWQFWHCRLCVLP